MPRYLIERRFELISEEEMAETARRAKRVTSEFPEVTWEHSHVVVDEGGAVTSFCIYEAPNEGIVRRHADAFGGHYITQLYEIAADVIPGEIQLES